MAVISIYDINAKANAIFKELIKEPNTDKSDILYDEMQVVAQMNLNMMRYLKH